MGAESLGNTPPSQLEKWPQVPPQNFPLEGEVPHSQASSPEDRPNWQSSQTHRSHAPTPLFYRRRNSKSRGEHEVLSTVALVTHTARSRLEVSDCLSPALAPSLGKVRQAESAGCSPLSSGAGERCPGSAWQRFPRPLPARWARLSPAPVWISVRRCEPPAQPLPPCPVQIHPQTCAQPAGMRQWLPDVDTNA